MKPRLFNLSSLIVALVLCVPGGTVISIAQPRSNSASETAGLARHNVERSAQDFEWEATVPHSPEMAISGAVPFGPQSVITDTAEGAESVYTADVTGEPAPDSAGSAESMTVSGLTPGQAYEEISCIHGVETRERCVPQALFVLQAQDLVHDGRRHLWQPARSHVEGRVRERAADVSPGTRPGPGIGVLLLCDIAK